MPLGLPNAHSENHAGRVTRDERASGIARSVAGAASRNSETSQLASRVGRTSTVASEAASAVRVVGEVYWCERVVVPALNVRPAPDHDGEWTPGVPVDFRTPEQLRRARGSVLGDFEHAAARVIARYLGQRVDLIDDGRRNRQVDIRIHYANGNVGVAEVVIDVDPA